VGGGAGGGGLVVVVVVVVLAVVVVILEGWGCTVCIGHLHRRSVLVHNADTG
jgi:hypothetical protein